MAVRARFVGRCIYCDSTDELSREHVVPEGIGGRLIPEGQHEAIVLNSASCPTCAEITKKLEEHCLRKMMGHFRVRAGMGRKDRQRDVHVVKYRDATDATIYRQVESPDLPAVLILPAYFEAGFLSGISAGGPYKIRLWYKVFDLGAKPAPQVGVAAAGIAPGDYARMLAKIGLGYAVAYFGIDGFKPLIRDFILGRCNNDFGHWVGGFGDTEPEAPSTYLHEIGLRPATHKTSKAEYILADIRLFAMYGAPRNYVIVGERQVQHRQDHVRL